jgi:CRP/FNR family transcriptional regulator, polysaccharide utilization system transcription regulator
MTLNSKEICKQCDGLCGFYSHMEEEDAGTLLKIISQVRYKKKEMLVKQNSHATNVYFLKSGLVKVFTERRNDKNIIIKVITPNNFIGLANLFSTINNFSAVALQDCEICVLPKESLISSILQNKSLAKYILELQSNYNAFIIDKISSLGTKQMHGRLADIILYLCGEEFEGTNVFDFIARKDIAEMAGMSAESAIRLLTEFKNDGLIKANGKKIEINNFELIVRLSEIG